MIDAYFMTMDPVLVGALAAFAIAVASAVYALGTVPPAAIPRFGRRGLKRHRARATSSSFAMFEPAIRLVGGWMRRLPFHGARRRAEQQLVQAGEYMGLTADEYLGLSLIGGVVGLVVGLLLPGESPLLWIAAASLSAFLPRLMVAREIERRRREINRALPTAIDLAALCMGAGLDFPRSLSQITENSTINDDPLNEEIQLILQDLELGHTRRRALEAFAVRVDSEAVRDFVASVVQAEERGNPLAEVLRIQAQVLRQRRSVKGEEAASRASILLIVPMVMLLLSVLLLIAGPLLLRTMGAFGG
jgi:tight adherence protein C